MKKIKYLPIWILLITLMNQSSALALIIQEMKNTAPVANFTVEKSREVKLLVLTDYTGAENANLKNALTSMRSELANYAKINIEYANPTDKIIGTQKGSVTINYWGKNGYAAYRKTGYFWSVNPYGQSNWQDFNGTPVKDQFVYSDTLELPEGHIPTQPYGVPNRYTRSALKTDTANPVGNRDYYQYTFMNASGICAGSFGITARYGYYYPNGAVQELNISFTEPTFSYEDFWSIQGSRDTPVTNTVTGWDLSGLSCEIQKNTDTFVIFALNNEDTNYYTSYLTANYRLGQLRSDGNLGKYVKDSEARVYSICSDTLENINLSTNPQYPVAFSGAAQNISLRDLIESSFDGRSIGQKNITGLVNKIRENIKRPSDKVDMIVATDRDISSTNSFVEGIKDNISSDVDFQTNVVNMDSLDIVDTWTKYVVKGDYNNIDTGGRTDVNLILAGNGDLWAQGSNKIGYDYSGNDLYGLFGQSTAVKGYSSFIKIATDVIDADFAESIPFSSIVIVKKDGSVWQCGSSSTYLHHQSFYNLYWYPKTKSVLIGTTGAFYQRIITISEDGRAMIDGGIDPYAPVNVQYVLAGNYSGSYNMSFYITNDGSIYYRSVSDNGTSRPAEFISKLPAPVKEISRKTGLIYCVNKMAYSISGSNLDKMKIKEAYLQSSTNWLIGEDNTLYMYKNGLSTYGYGGFKKILFAEPDGRGVIGIDLNDKISYFGEVMYSNLFSTDYTLAGKKAQYYGNPKPFDVSINGNAADYLRIGNHFAYVTKKGEVCYIDNVYTGTDSYTGEAKYTFQTVNMGKADTIFDTSSKPVKAFSKSKIFHTPLREGSERYFVYISDNIEKDTYFKDPSEYFLFDNLDSTVLNYLNANRFNIYVVSPAEARELKLQYPYTPVNRQQYTLRELIYNSVMDSAFCKDENTVRTLIVRKYDTFTKQGSTTLTLLVNEESVRYNQIYSDFEHDPKHSEKWQYTHDPTCFDNSNGLDSNSGKWITDPPYIFSKVGKYTVVSQFRDNPKDDNRFDSYRLWSNVSAPATIIVHRRPVALFDTQIAERAGAVVNLTYLDRSYDPDHNLSRTDKGIAVRLWQYKKASSYTWNEGKPASLAYNSGVYQIGLSVKDIEGAWSSPYIDTIDTVNVPPSITAAPTEYNGTGPVNITIKASDNGENDFAYMRYAFTGSTDLPAASQWIKEADGRKERIVTLNKDCTYYLHMEACDKAGQTGKNMTGPYTINNVKAGQFFITMMLDPGWQSHYFDISNGIDDNHDGEIDRYPRKTNTDIGTLKMPINYFNLVGHPRTYIKAGYRVKGKIDIQGAPEYAEFHINYLINSRTYTDKVQLTKGAGSAYYFEWTIPLETDNKSFISFDLQMKKGSLTYGNEKWKDTWEPRNTSRFVFYVKGAATDDLIYVQSQ